MLIIIITAWVLLMAIGQVLFKYSAIYSQSAKGIVSSYLLNPYLITAVFLYMIATILWVYILGKLPLKQAYPLNSFGFVIVPILGMLIFKETLTPGYWLGIAFILIGLFIIALKV